MFRRAAVVLFLASITLPLLAERPYAIKAEFNRRVAMRDGVELSADIYRPDARGKFPVILSRTPYMKPSAYNIAKNFVPHGYVWVAMDVRGRGDSDGKFVPYVNDGPDGYDAIEWCAKQPWSTGKVATIGGSYNGRIQWLTAILNQHRLELGDGAVDLGHQPALAAHYRAVARRDLAKHCGRSAPSILQFNADENS